jgi:DNA-binding CsgD family transcriptional regulator
MKTHILTPRQRDVFLLACNGLKNAEIAYELHVTKRAVETYKYRAKKRVHAQSTEHFVATVLKQTYLDFLSFFASGNLTLDQASALDATTMVPAKKRNKWEREAE